MYKTRQHFISERFIKEECKGISGARYTLAGIHIIKEEEEHG
jgi:hypothetical protein